MNANIARLAELGASAERHVVGLMSGTSLDGLDVALCRIRGHGRDTSVRVERFATVDYSGEERSRIAAVFSARQVDLQHLTLLHAWLGRRHGEIVNDCLAAWGVAAADVDLIASHGQTVYHCPRSLHGRADYPNATLQLGDGDHVAMTTGITTVSDFRQKHVAAGGEGAPLAIYGDYFVFAADDESRVLLNLGGIANLTWLPRGGGPGDVIATDIGPGNTLMDAAVRRLDPAERFDRDGGRASRGKVVDALLDALLDHAFFGAPWPRTAGPELFNLNYVDEAINAGGVAAPAANDLLATLNRFTVEAVGRAVESIDAAAAAVYVSGGGARNTALLKALTARLAPRCVTTTAALGIDPDAKEAVLFAILANEAVAGIPVSFSAGENPAAAVALGKISFAG
ncbi:MAG: anhydro-N-acetylmuramic acid kinase [Pseudomonadota bacterium]